MSGDAYGVAMSESEIAELLVETGHGVLSFGGDRPYSIPMSFGYDVDDDRCVLQLLFNPESKKRDYVAAETPVSLVTYEWEGPSDWRSVVVDGDLAPIENESPAAVEAAGVFAPYATTVSLSVFDRPVEELDAQWYELRIREKRGRQSPVQTAD